MSRTLSAGITAQIALGRSRTVHLLVFGPVNGTTYYLAEDAVRAGGIDYLPYLKGDFSVKYDQKLQVNPVAVQLDNVDLAMVKIMRTQQTAVQGVPATLSRFWREINESLVLFTGIVKSMDVDERTVMLTLGGGLDPTASQVPARQYLAKCAWKFKDARCGYVDGVDPDDPLTSLPYTACPKDFLSCTDRGRKHRFPGFLHIMPDLTRLYEGTAPDSTDRGRMLDMLIRPWEEI